MIGQNVGGRYRVIRVLGEGGMGVVYEGEQQMGSTKRKVAIKTLHPQLSNDPSVSARFHRECGVVAQLEHPNTIKVYDFGSTDNGTLYIAMEFLDGDTLTDVIEKAAIEPSRVAKLASQIAGSLGEAHGQGIIHRDLKPDNVLLINRAGESDVVKLLDFGIAARTESADAEKEAKLTQQGMVLGTPPYMSPEQFTGQALDQRSDIYSLAILCYEMLTGQLPFQANTPWQWATEHMTAQPIPFEKTNVSTAIPAPMRAAILKGLSKDPDDRQPTAKEFLKEFTSDRVATIETAAQGAPTSATSGTAAMDAAPDFRAEAPAATAAMPAAAASAPAAVAAAAPAVSAPSGGSNKGLIMGLTGVGGVIVLAMVVIGARSMKPKDDTLPNLDPIATTPPPTENVPSDPDPGSGTKGGSAPETASGSKSSGSKPSGSKPEKKTEPAPDKPQMPPPPKPPPPKPPPPKPPPPAPPKVSSAQACSACISAAQSGNIPGASASFRQCKDSGKKARCRTIARTSAPRAAKSAALNGRCSQVKAIVRAANSMGAGSGRLTNNAKKCN